MAKIDRLLSRWANNPPKEELADAVLAVIKRYFRGQYRNPTGSHIVISHPDLIGEPLFAPKGEFTVIIKRGKKVKGEYVQRLAQVILDLGLREQEKKQREREREEQERMGEK